MPRCGTSLLMQLAWAAGLTPILGGRGADQFNERGYFEPSWMRPEFLVSLNGWDGAVKAFLPRLSEALDAGFRPERILLADRDAYAVQQSWAAFQGRNIPEWMDPIRNADALGVVRDSGIPMLTVEYEGLLADPTAWCGAIVAFLGRGHVETLAKIPDARLNHH
jgi:hypothetical protein